MLTAVLVEDNLYDRECILKFVDWAALDIRVVAVAQNGEDGLKSCLEHRPDIVLTDISMPKMDGLEMVRKLDEARLSAHVIIMSCHDEFEYAQAAIGMNVARYVLKPVDLPELQDALTEAAQAKWEEAYQRVNVRHMEKRAAENKPILISDLMRELTQLRMAGDTELATRLDYLGVHFRSTQIVAVIRLDAHPDCLPDMRGAVLLKVATEETFRCPGYVYVVDTSTVCVVMTGDWPSEDDFLEKELPRFALLKEFVQNQVGCSITMGISQPVQAISDLSAAFRAANEAVNQRFFRSGNRILLASHIEAPQERPATPSFTDIRDRLQKVMENGGEGEAEAFVSAYLPQNRNCTEAHIRETGSMITLALQLYLEELNTAVQDIPGYGASVIGTTAFMESVAEIHEWLVRLLTDAGLHIRQSSGGRRSMLAAQIKGIIDRDYASIKTISQIARQVYTSAGHANMLFKQETGVTIGDYLFERRMEAAKTLLHKPHCRIYEVAEQVGYATKSYFSNAFKEYCGCTPREYRERNCTVASGQR